MATPKSELVEVVQITLWLAKDLDDRQVEISACKSTNEHPGRAHDFHREGNPGKASGKDLLNLVEEVLRKLLVAYPAGEPITLSILDGTDIVASPIPVEKSADAGVESNAVPNSAS